MPRNLDQGLHGRLKGCEMKAMKLRQQSLENVVDEGGEVRWVKWLGLIRDLFAGHLCKGGWNERKIAWINGRLERVTRV